MFVRKVVLTGWMLLASLLALPCAWGAEATGAEPEGKVVAEEEGAVAGGGEEDRAEEVMLQFAHGQGTSVGNTLIRRYVGSDHFVRRATTPNEMEKFDKVVDLFKKYSAQYDLDYRLMIAQGYQESRLDQNAKSSVSAVGIMQLMPATGKEMKVGNYIAYKLVTDEEEARSQAKDALHPDAQL